MARNGKSYTRLHVLQPEQSARIAGLRYVNDEHPGFRRVRGRRGFRYVDGDGHVIRDAATLGRIRSLAIPPAWTDVWICTRADGHLQASGRDARGRKQYRYHKRWREFRDETKYGRMLAFAKALPKIHRRVRQDLARPGLPREKALATVVRLLETTCIRVGNEEYARENDSFGLTTLRTRQVKVRGDKLKFSFRGKSGVHHDVELSDAQVAGIVRRMRDLPGYELFCYLDESGGTHTISSDDVNAYVRDIAGDEFTSKDFRTWAGTVLAGEALRAMPRSGSAAEAKRNVQQAVEAVARRLGNTKAVCRKSYIHPAVLDSYVEDTLHDAAGRTAVARIVAILSAAARKERTLAQRSGANGSSLAPVLSRSIQRLARRSRKSAAQDAASA